ncbi:MAG: fasciclin domain-containing protein [Methanoregula sp.]|uniref:fasciclin domain-containing protein n=1 Tax=Methanoregula sp. TaxID=2052170 RepID=UPI003BAF7D4C
MSPQVTITETLAADYRFSIMTGAVRAAGFDTLLGGRGPFTFCAPTDEAFRSVPNEILESLMADPQGKLMRVLQYHILFGNLPCAIMKRLNFPKTRLGITVEITEEGGAVLFSGAMVTVPDITCTNGVIHGINRIIIPR